MKTFSQVVLSRIVALEELIICSTKNSGKTDNFLLLLQWKRQNITKYIKFYNLQNNSKKLSFFSLKVYLALEELII